MARPEDILAFLKSILVEIKDIDEEAITPDSTLEAVALDSLDYVELQLAMKKKYGIVLSQDALLDGSIRTVGDFCSHVHNAILAVRKEHA